MRISSLILTTIAGTIGLMLTVTPLIYLLYFWISTGGSSSRSSSISYSIEIPPTVFALAIVVLAGIAAAGVATKHPEWRYWLAPVLLIAAGVGFFLTDWRLWVLTAVIYGLAALEMFFIAPKKLYAAAYRPAQPVQPPLTASWLNGPQSFYNGPYQPTDKPYPSSNPSSSNIPNDQTRN